MQKTHVAIDLGSSSGRVMLGGVTDARIHLTELSRFPNAPVMREDRWHWDIGRLWSAVLEALRAATQGANLAGIAVDTWGVDYGLLDGHGKLIGEPYSYRDDRTLPIVEVAAARMAPERLYALTGCQAVPINTLYQLLADQQPVASDGANRFQMIPELLPSGSQESPAPTRRSPRRRSSLIRLRATGAGRQSTPCSCLAALARCGGPARSSGKPCPIIRTWPGFRSSPPPATTPGCVCGRDRRSR